MRSLVSIPFGTLTFIVKVLPKANFSGMDVASMDGLSTPGASDGGIKCSTLNSEGKVTPGPGAVTFWFGLLPAMRKKPCAVSVILEW